MPPRKKATTNTPAAASTRTTRSSSRTKPTPVSTIGSTKPPSKAAKRVRASSDSEEEKPAAKKSKTKAKAKAKADEDDAEEADRDVVDDEPPKKMVTIVKRGAAAVDPMSSFVGTHQVYVNSEDIWDARMNQTEIAGNKNKFYIIQLLHPIGNTTSCQLFTRWGRVGENGQTQLKGPFPSHNAVHEFKKQFKSKSGTDWENRRGMVAKPGKYIWLEPAEEGEEKDNDEKGGKKDGNAEKDEVIPDSTLAPELQSLCNLIFSTQILNATLESMQYDANKLPLGKLSKSTVLNGFAALKKLAEVIEKPTGDLAKSLGGGLTACSRLSDEYYSVIPHVFGRQRPTNISSLPLLKKELELVDALGDMDFAQSIISSAIQRDASGNPLNPLDAHFKSLGLTSMEPVNPTSAEFNALAAYARDTHGATHNYYQAKVLNAFRVERAGETDAWIKAGFDKLADGDKLLLWHGSRTTNFAGILSQGLRIAPPEAPVTGYMFGKGVYFADMMSKSANYCYSNLSNSIGLLLLCEVAAKPFHEAYNSDYYADQSCKNNKKLVTKGIGRTQPTKWKDAAKALSNPALAGCHMPDGPGQNVSDPQAYLQYNEYIAYDISQIRLRYLLMVEMK